MPAKKPPEPPDDHAGYQVLEHLAARFRLELETKAEQIKNDRRAAEITAEIVETAYRRLTTPPDRRTDAKKLVATAFKENRLVEWTGYGMAVVLFVLGAAMLLFGMLGTAETGARVASLVGGSVAELVLVIPLRFWINARRHNFGLHVLAYLLDRVDDPAALADGLRRLIGEVTPYGQRREGKE